MTVQEVFQTNDNNGNRLPSLRDVHKAYEIVRREHPNWDVAHVLAEAEEQARIVQMSAGSIATDQLIEQPEIIISPVV